MLKRLDGISLRKYSSNIMGETSINLSFMDSNYFKDFTTDNLKLYADYLRNQGIVDSSESQTDEDVARNYSGDSYIRVLFEDKYNLVVLSVDSGIRVVNCIAKTDMDKSQTVELQ